MAASPVSFAPPVISAVTNVRRRRFALTQRRLEANRRNARRSSGPRTAEGKARVARNAIKHGFFVAQEQWTSAQQRDFDETREGLREDFQPHGMLEESCVATIAESYVRMAAMLRYENIAAFDYHQQRERELEQRIAAAQPSEAARLAAGREELRRAGLWRPTLPGPREAMAIMRYQGRLERAIRHAASELEVLKKLRIGGVSTSPKSQKQTHYADASRGGPGSLQRALTAALAMEEIAKTNPLRASGAMVLSASRRASNPAISRTQSAKTNPLSSMFTGNRHQRRRAEALAKRRR